jgi:hypothetical protein
VVALLHAALASKSVNGRVVLKTIAGLLLAKWDAEMAKARTFLGIGS